MISKDDRGGEMNLMGQKRMMGEKMVEVEEGGGGEGRDDGC